MNGCRNNEYSSAHYYALFLKQNFSKTNVSGMTAIKIFIKSYFNLNPAYYRLFVCFASSFFFPGKSVIFTKDFFEVFEIVALV